MRERHRFVFFFLTTVFWTSCVSLPRSFHALSYKNQEVTIDRHHSYLVGPLSPSWQRLKNENPGIVFKHQSTGSTLATEALCGAAFEDLSLKVLSGQLLAGLENVQKIKEESWVLSGREALYTELQANLDGVPVLLNLVVLKKNRCQFDFLNVAPLKEARPVTEDFLKFVKGFDYP